MTKCPSNAPRVLLIDDDQIYVSMFEMFADELSFSYDFANCESAALDILSQSADFDLVVIDYFLGSGTGLECALNITNKFPRFAAEGRLVIMSGIPSESTFVAEIEKHGIRFLERPLNLMTLPGIFCSLAAEISGESPRAKAA